jgi:hypothetical protein
MYEMSQVNIIFNGENVGSIQLRQPDLYFPFVRTASGFRLNIPTLITLSPPANNRTPLLLGHLRVTFFALDEAGRQVEIGTALHGSLVRTPAKDIPVSLPWDWSFLVFAVYERMRAGKEPHFRFAVSGDIHHVFPGDGGKDLYSVPTVFYQWGEISYSRDTWLRTIKELSIQDFVVLEIPFLADPPNAWEPVWHALRDARDSFEKGGSTGWKNSVTSVRLALEEWQKIEKEDQGSGWQRPPIQDLQNRTKEQRIDNIRWHLIQLAHYAAHTRADEWTKDDALLALSTLCALIAVRKP